MVSVDPQLPLRNKAGKKISALRMAGAERYNGVNGSPRLVKGFHPDNNLL